MSEILLKFAQVDYTYPGASQPSLHGLTLNIPKHKKTALIGQNGSGKTTLFLLANGLDKPQKGQVFYQDQPYLYQNQFLRTLRQKVALVFQNPEQQIVAPTVEEDISYGLYNLGLTKSQVAQQVVQALRDFGLMELATKPVHHLSLGQKKLVSLADVMVLKPEILLLDEPTAYLDILHQRQLLEILQHLDCQTQVMATHDLDLVYAWADWVFVLDKGRLILEGTPEEVFDQRDMLNKLHLGRPLSYEILEAIADLIPIDDPQTADLKAKIQARVAMITKIRSLKR